MKKATLVQRRENFCFILLGAVAGCSFLAQPSALTALVAAVWLLCFFLHCRAQGRQLALPENYRQAVLEPSPDAACAPDTPLQPAEADAPRLASETAILFLQIDNLDDVLQGMDEAQRNTLQAETHRLLVAWGGRLNGFFRKYSDDTYIGVFSLPDLERMICEKFEILDEVRLLRTGNRIPVTLSLGISAIGKTMTERGQKAQTGLDLALGRGGDQAAVYMNDEVQFYGGKAKVVEKSTRVKARVVAHAIRELMREAPAIFIMGHDGEDFDSLGAALGVARMARYIGKPVNIVIGEAGMSFSKLQELLPDYAEYAGLFLTAKQAEAQVTRQTLLFVLDTHRRFLTAAPQLLDMVDRRVVIDHHRRSEDFIPNPMLVYLEPSASSTSELVTELLMYFAEKIELTRLEAAALYAGIVVDTKNFAVQTGVRTFEAASFLRRSGADPVLVRHLFRVDVETIRQRAKILTGVQMLPGGVAVAECPTEVKNGQIIAAQSADAMLSIEGVRVSFVLFPSDGGVGISARSNGDVNVQVIMEVFGGGGHQTVAGAHIDGVDVSEARRRLEAVITDFIGEVVEA